MSNLSDLLPSGGGQNIVEFTASGTVASGKPVILNANGTVSQVAGTSADQAIGSETQISLSAIWLSSTFDSSNNKVVYAYRDNLNSDYGTAVVGTVASDNSITFGTPVVYNSAQSDENAVTFDSSNNKVVIAYQDDGNSSYGTAIVGTVSGTSISFGSETVFNAGRTELISATFDSNLNKVVIAYEDDPNSSRGTAVVGTVSGTSISFGSEVVFSTDITSVIAATFDSSNNKVVIVFKAGDISAGAIVGTVSGTSISFGSAVNFDTEIMLNFSSAVFDSYNNKVIVFYHTTENNYGKAVVGTVSDTSISFGSPVVVHNAVTSDGTVIFDSNANKLVFTYVDGSNSDYGTLVVGTVSGTSISVGSEVVFHTGSTSTAQSTVPTTFDSNLNKVVIGYRVSSAGKSIVFQNQFSNTNLTSTNFLGLAAGAISDTATGKINVKGSINSKQSSLTIGSDNYVQSDGSVSTTSTSPAVKIGQAVTATTINMMDLT